MCAVGRVCLLYDAQSIGGSVIRAQEAVERLADLGLELGFIYCIAEETVLNSLDDFFGRLAETQSQSAPRVKDGADILLATMSGLCLGKAILTKCFEGVVLASNDKRLALTLGPWITSHLSVHLLTFNADPEVYKTISPELEVINLEKIRRPVKRAEETFDIEIYPYIYNADVPFEVAGLEVLAVPVERQPVPRFIPIPMIAGEISIGANLTADIPLGFWAQRKSGIYSPHAFLSILTSAWGFRSAKGFRRGKKSVTVNGQLIDASAGSVRLISGDEITIGGFRFRVRPVDQFHEKFLTLGESDYDSIAHIEGFLHTEARKVLVREADDWWESLVPLEIASACKERATQERSAEHPYRFVFLRELAKIVVANWDLFRSTFLGTLCPSKTQLRRVFSETMMVRNKIMHPTRAELSEQERVFIRRLRATLIANKEQVAQSNCSDQGKPS